MFTNSCGVLGAFALLSIGCGNANLISQTPATRSVEFPGTEWAVETGPELTARMKTPQCKAFVDFAANPEKTGFETDGLVVIKDGKLQYEYYAPKYTASSPHALWSVTKTITGALLGIAVRDGRIDLDDKLSDFYPPTRDQENSAYGDIRIRNLFYLDSGLNWSETYGGNVSQSPVLDMLFGEGRHDMAKYAASQPMMKGFGPGEYWKYTTGTPVITMGILKQVYGKDYDRMPWDLLFDRLGMKNVVIERDDAGNFIGGAGGFMTPRDMARFGYLYLNQGQWNGEMILPQSWIEKTLTVSPGRAQAATPLPTAHHAVFGGSLWLNRLLPGMKVLPYPYSPSDLFLAIGRDGQFVIVLPSQNMVIARTGHDAEYDSKIDPMVSRAVSCFSNPAAPVAPIQAVKGFTPGIGVAVQTLETGAHTGILQAAAAQWVCSCHFISGVDEKTCLDRSGVPAASLIAKMEVRDGDEIAGHLSLLAEILTLSDRVAEASYDSDHPEYGCRLK